MTSQDYHVVKILKNKLSQIVSILDIRVFGSRARGDAHEYSDMDVFLEVPALTKELKERIFEVTWEVGVENSIVISVLIFTRDEIENSPLRAASIVENILTEGIKV